MMLLLLLIIVSIASISYSFKSLMEKSSMGTLVRSIRQARKIMA